MQKIAFNLAFDVSHNIRTFDEALLEAVDAGVERDLVKILNSMTKDRLYDVGNLASLIEEAKQNLHPSEAKTSEDSETPTEPETEASGAPLADMETLQNEMTQLVNERSTLMESLRELEQDMSDLNPTLVSAMKMKTIVFLCIGLGIVLFLAAMDLIYFAFLFLIAVLFVFLVSVANEKSAMKRKITAKNPGGQKLFERQIAELKEKIVQTDKQIRSKEEAIKAAQVIEIGKSHIQYAE